MRVGRPRKYNIDEAYRLYEEKYDKLAKQQRKRGQSPRYSKMSFDDFASDWEENRLEYGSKYSGKQVAEALAKKDVYQHSFKQGKAIYKALEADVDFQELNVNQRSFALQYQQGVFDKPLADFWQRVEEHREALKDEGYSKKDVAKEIGQMFFGS